MAPRDRRPRRGLQTELLLGLALVMATATTVLLLVGLRIQEARLEEVWPLAAGTLANRAAAPLGPTDRPSGAQWWRVHDDGFAEPRSDGPPIDAETHALASKARDRGEPLLARGAPWEPVRFAAPDAGGVSAMRLPAAAPPTLLAVLVAGAIAIFTAFGSRVLRGRVVGPLERLSEGVRAVAAGDLGVRIVEEGVAETAEMARAFNEMTESLALRTEALEKAVTELRDSNRQLRTAREGLERAERLAAVGRLAAGVAHEVGNPVGALLAFVDLASRDPGLSEPGRAHLAKARRQVERVRSILRDLLGFARPAKGECLPVDLAALADEILELVRAQRRYANVAFDVVREDPLPTPRSDRSALAQLLLNLVLNAGDAVRERGGRVRVRLSAAAFQSRSGEGPESAAERRQPDAVALCVEDDGPGIPEEDRERVFDPFFTTKGPGEGTGLGLSNALRMAEQLGGRLDLAPGSPGAGATFVLTLPAATAESGVAARRGDADVV